MVTRQDSECGASEDCGHGAELSQCRIPGKGNTCKTGSGNIKKVLCLQTPDEALVYEDKGREWYEAEAKPGMLMVKRF